MGKSCRVSSIPAPVCRSRDRKREHVPALLSHVAGGPNNVSFSHGLRAPLQWQLVPAYRDGGGDIGKTTPAVGDGVVYVGNTQATERLRYTVNLPNDGENGHGHRGPNGGADEGIE